MALLVEKKFLGVRKRPNLSNFFVFFCTMRPWPFWISIWIPNECRCDFKIYALNLWTLICNSLKIWNKNPNTTSKRLITHCFSLLRNKMMLSQKIYYKPVTENVKNCCLQIQYSWGRIWPSCLIKIAYFFTTILFDSKILVVIYDNHL